MKPGRRLLVTLAVDLLLYAVLRAVGLEAVPAHVLACVGGALAGFTSEVAAPQRVRFATILALIASLRGVFAFACLERIGLPELVVLAPAIGLSTVALWLGRDRFLAPVGPLAAGDTAGWRRSALFILGYTVVLRAVLIVAMDLLYEESYYWNYGQHLALGYLDHPPMVGWVIRAFTELLGSTEITVRLPAFLSWAVAALFLFRFARNLHGAAAAWRTLVLFAILPIYLGIGTVMTPDPPLYACWAGTLYFLERAILGERRGAWIGVGVCLGLGMLSKYTIALLGPAVLLFLALDPRSRRLFRRPEPYIAVALATLLFLPVIVWNAENDWASFAYQSSRRVAQVARFSLPHLLGAVLLLLTPTGVVAAYLALRAPREGRRRADLFVATLTLVPFAVFVAASLFHQPKLNWPGPVWLALLPAMGLGMVQPRMLRLWRLTAAIVLLIFSGGMLYVALGQPGMPPVQKLGAPLGWRELVAESDVLARAVATETGALPLQTGADINTLSSQVSFYSAMRDARLVTGRHLFGRESRMWVVWAPSEGAVGRDVLILAQRHKELRDGHYAPFFDRLSPIEEVPVRRNGKLLTHLYWRVGYAYRESPLSPP